MSNIRYYNQSGPFWDFIASLEAQNISNSNTSRAVANAYAPANEDGETDDNELEHDPEHDSEHEYPTANDDFSPFGWGGPFGFGGNMGPFGGGAGGRGRGRGGYGRGGGGRRGGLRRHGGQAPHAHHLGGGEGTSRRGPSPNRGPGGLHDHPEHGGPSHEKNEKHGGPSHEKNEKHGRAPHEKYDAGEGTEHAGPHNHYRGPPPPHGGPHRCCCGGPGRHGGHGHRGGRGGFPIGGNCNGSPFNLANLAEFFQSQLFGGGGSPTGVGGAARATDATAAVDAKVDSDKNGGGDFSPSVDVFDTDSAFILHVSLPGAKKEDISVTWDAEASTLTLSGVVHRPGDEELIAALALDERRSEIGAFERKVRLGSRASPAEVDAEGISAKLEEGVLRVRVPKEERGFVEVRMVDVE